MGSIQCESKKLLIAARRIMSWAVVFTVVVLSATLGLSKTAPGDLDCFLAAGRAAHSGLNPYNAPSLRYSNVFGSYIGPAINMSPPITLLVYAPLSQYETDFLFPYWKLGSVAFYLLSVALLTARYRPRPIIVVWTLTPAALWVSIGVGQIYTFLAFLVVAAWLSLEKHASLLAGCLIGILVAVKPNFAVWPVLLLIGGNRKTGFAALIVAFLLSMAPAAVWGPSIYYEWLKYSSGAGEMFFPSNMSLVGIFLRAGIAPLGYILSLLLLFFVAIWTIFTRPRANALHTLSLVSSLLACPAAWVGYTILLLPVFFFHELNKRLVASAILGLFPAFLLWSLGALNTLFLNLVGLIYPALLACVFSIALKGGVELGSSNIHRHTPIPG